MNAISAAASPASTALQALGPARNTPGTPRADAVPARSIQHNDNANPLSAISSRNVCLRAIDMV
jgi:hypothetical protein